MVTGVVVAITTVVGRWAFSRTMTAFEKMAFPDDLQARLDKAANKWKETLPTDAELLDIHPLFADKIPNAPNEVPPEPLEVMAKLKAQQIPNVSDWLASLLRQWEWIRAVKPEGRQPFFEIDKARAETLLRDLAERLNKECQADRVLFQVEALGLLSGVDAKLDSIISTQEAQRQESDGVHHATIDVARSFVKEGKPDVTIVQLEALQRSANLTKREQYRVYANLGHAYQAKDEKEKAAECFIKSAQYQPNDENARALEAVGYYMRGDNARALEIALKVIAEFPTADLASSMRIRTEPPNRTFEEIESTVSEPLKLLPETRLALSLRAMQADKYDEAERYARLALEPDDKSAVVSEQLAVVLLNRVRVGSHSQLAMPPQAGAMKPIVIEAQSLLATAHSAIPASAKISTGRIRFFQGVAAFYLDEIFVAEGHFRAAIDSSPKDPEYIRHLAIILHEQKRADDAIRILRDGLQFDHTGRIGITLASSLLQRKTDSDRAEAIEVLQKGMSQLEDIPPHAKEAYIDLLSQAYGISKRHSDAAALLDRERSHLTDEAFHTLKAGQLRRSGDQEKATDEIRQALAKATKSDDVVVKRMTADELTAQCLWHEALPIWKELIKPNGFGPYTAALLQCAWNTDDHGFLLDFCQQLRANGIYEHDTFHLEINTLWEYNGTDAVIAAIQAYLASPDDQELAKGLRLRLSHLAILLGDKSLECFDLSQLPSADEARPDLGLMAVMLLVHGPRPLDAVEYAYTLVRKHFSSNAANKAMITSVLWRPRDLKLPESSVVSPGFAVRYKDNDSDEERWHVVEDSTTPDASRNEFGVTHPLSVSMMGKSVNQTFLIRKDDVQEKTGTVLQILSKYGFRAGRCLDEWETKFAEDRWLWKFTSKKTDDPKVALAPAFKAIDKQAAFVADRERDYRNNSLASPTIFAAMTGISVLEAVQHLATKEDLPIRCGIGSGEESSKAAEAMKSVGALVVDIAALSTLFVTNLASELAGLKCKLIVPRGAVLNLRERLLEMKNAGNRRLTKDGDRHVFIEESDDLVLQRITVLEEFIATINTLCEIHDGTALAYLPVADRERLAEVAGSEAAESIALAQKLGCPIWTDDLVVGVAANQFGVARIWTDFLLQMPESPWQMKYRKRHLFIAMLERFGFQFTRLSAEAVLRTCQEADWNLDDIRVRLVLKWFSTRELTSDLVTAVTFKTLLRIWNQAPNQARAYEVVSRILKNICQRGDSKMILKKLREIFDKGRGMDSSLAGSLKRTIEIWLR